ncbi:MAG TPA: ShlB/FhaC/HecB family hemolysin secretion/activation protein [Gemmatimonadales bacterium]|nr:ShlB/FhaC/HecB family hemolysin secretion/activation protein [Gemmatimonadales bacterium]
MARHRAQDTAVVDYRARLRYRLSVSLGRRRWAQIPVTAIEEQEALVAWQRPNDLRVDVIGRRFRTRDPDWDFSSVFYRPWFVPRGIGDSVRFFSDRFPATAALHPLAATGPDWYRYALRDSITVATPGGESIRIYVVDVVPARTGPALVAGRLWIDAASAEVVRLTFRYVGTGLFVRSRAGRRSEASARRINAIANRIVSVDADLEYALQDGKFWMPYRQSIAGRLQIPILNDIVIPFEAVTTFSDYQLNTGTPIAFTLALPDTTLPWDSLRVVRRLRRDSLRAERRQQNVEATRTRSWDYADRWPGGRYELHRPPNDSLARYAAWDDSLELALDQGDRVRLRDVAATLARMSDSLPDELTGARGSGFGYERLADAVRYDRVQGYSLGLGYHVRVPGLEFTDLQATVRYGFSNERVTGSLSLIRDAPGGRLRISGYREVASVDPLGRGPSVGNTLNAIFAAHDDADYALVTGGSASFETSVGIGWELSVSGRVERERSVITQATSDVNDFLGGRGIFPPNPPITEGTFAGGTARLAYNGRTRWALAADILGGVGTTTVRGWGELRRDVGGKAGLTLRAKAGIASLPLLPQSAFRLGGLNTVRGFDYGTVVGQAFWSAQLDIAPLPGRVRPVFFADAGQAGAADGLFSTQALAGAGVGLSFFRGALRFDLSRRLSPDVARLRFDLVVGAVR